MGNLDTKLSPYYSINEDYSIKSSDDALNNNATTRPQQSSSSSSSPSSLSLGDFMWTIKRCTYNNESKNAMLHELNTGRLLNESTKRVPQKYIAFAFNQIRVIII
jgi:hypothetical protein